MRYSRLILMSIAVSTMMILGASAADNEGNYSVATVESVEKVANTSMPQPTTESGLMADVDMYRITTDLGGKKYVVEYEALGDPDHDMKWLVGKKYEAYVQGKTMYVKSQSGRVMKLPIVSAGK